MERWVEFVERWVEFVERWVEFVERWVEFVERWVEFVERWVEFVERWTDFVERCMYSYNHSYMYPCMDTAIHVASKLYGVNATIIIFVFVLYCIVFIHASMHAFSHSSMHAFSHSSMQISRAVLKAGVMEEKMKRHEDKVRKEEKEGGKMVTSRKVSRMIDQYWKTEVSFWISSLVSPRLMPQPLRPFNFSSIHFHIHPSIHPFI